MLILCTDGACRDNPGPASVGASLQFPDGTEIGKLSEFIGERTNNEAEYEAVIRGLKLAATFSAKHAALEIRSDSELLVKQMSGEYRVRKPELAALREVVLASKAPFAAVKFVWVPRETPGAQRADALANDALDKEGFPKSEPPWKHGR